MNRQLVQWFRLRLCSHCLKYHRGRVEMISAELWNMELLDISTVKSKILPIVSVEDIPVEASMPNLVQLCQKTLLWNNDVRRFPTTFDPPDVGLLPLMSDFLGSLQTPPHQQSWNLIKIVAPTTKIEGKKIPSNYKSNGGKLYQKTLLEKLFLTGFFGVYE